MIGIIAIKKTSTMNCPATLHRVTNSVILLLKKSIIIKRMPDILKQIGNINPIKAKKIIGLMMEHQTMKPADHLKQNIQRKEIITVKLTTARICFQF
jgi:hypothetical protein